MSTGLTKDGSGREMDHLVAGTRTTVTEKVWLMKFRNQGGDAK